MSIAREQYLKNALAIIVILLGGILFYESTPFLGGFLGACTIYFLVRNQMKRLVKKGYNKSLSAAFILIEASLIFLIPTGAIVWLLINKISSLDLNIHTINVWLHNVVDFINVKTGYDLLGVNSISKVASNATKVLQVLVDQLGSFGMSSLVMILVLYFMLVAQEEMERYVYEMLPFKSKYKKQVLVEIKQKVVSNAVGIPILALVQGFLAGVAYWFFDIPDALLFAFVTAFATIIPLFGTALVWGPLALYLGLNGSWGAAIGLTVYAVLIISSVDNLVRFMLQEKLASTHPLITIFGVIIGLSLFGFWGIIFGPLLISMFVLCLNIYKAEYIDNLK